MYKVQIDNDEEVAIRSVFAGQMAFFREQGQDDSLNEIPCEPVTIKQIHDSISAFAFSFRKEIYSKKLKLSSTSASESVAAQFDMLYDCLDLGLLATLFALLGDQDSSTKNHDLFMDSLSSLLKVGFRYFLYGAISWEYHRKLHLGPKLDEFLSGLGSEEEHDCIKCLSGSDNCQHACCQNLALKFVAKCGLVNFGDDGSLRLERNGNVENTKKAESQEPAKKKKKKSKKTCQCSDSCSMNPGKCGFHKTCCIRLNRQCTVVSHRQSNTKSKVNDGNSNCSPIVVDDHNNCEPKFDFTASLDDVWQGSVPEETIVAEQHGCSVTILMIFAPLSQKSG